MVKTLSVCRSHHEIDVATMSAEVRGCNEKKIGNLRPTAVCIYPAMFEMIVADNTAHGVVDNIICNDPINSNFFLKPTHSHMRWHSSMATSARLHLNLVFMWEFLKKWPAGSRAISGVM